MKAALQFDYTAAGHVTIDVLADGTRRPGGSAFYSALQAARLGLRTLILTQGVPREIEELLEPYAAELELRVMPARHTTTLLTSGWGRSRIQRVLAWAGPMDRELKLDTAILHLAPVAREGLTSWSVRNTFVGLTPQGLMREFPRAGGKMSLGVAPRACEQLATRCDALVLSQQERAGCAALIERGLDNGALVAITAEERPSTLLLADGSKLELGVPEVSSPVDDLGAGDVFAAALFEELAAGSAPESAVAFATAAAAVRMQEVGASAIGDRSLIEARLHALSRRP